MRQIHRVSSLLVAFIAAAGMVVPGVAAAAASNSGSGNGFKVSPVRTDLTINPGSSQTVKVYITNITGGTESLKAVMNDFEPSNDESGSPALLLNGQPAPSHGLKQFVSLPGASFTLQPNQTQEVDATITIPSSAKGGGYYGAVRVLPSNLDATKTVNLAASVASLILVRVPGHFTEQMSLAGFDIHRGTTGGSIFTSPQGMGVTVRFQNSGDVQEQPFGKILVLKGNKVVDTEEVNNTDPRGNVLPASIRKFDVPLKHLGSFGKYTVEGNFGYGTTGQLLSAKATFYIIPLWTILAVVVAIVVLLFLIFGLPRLLKRHDRSVLRRAGRR